MFEIGKTLYIIDTSVFIQAKDTYYRREICPAFWIWLIRELKAGHVTSIAHVRTELQAGDGDWLVTWPEEEDIEMFPATKEATTPNHAIVTDYINGLSKKPRNRKREFLGGADSELIAYALHQKSQLEIVDPIVVTWEKSAKEAHAIKIPDVCEHFNIGCIKPFEMLERENVRFVLEERKP